MRKSWLWAGGALALLACVAVLVFRHDARTTQRHFLIPHDFSGQVFVIHTEGYDGPQPIDSVQMLQVPANGILVTRERMPGPYADEYYDVVPGGKAAPLPVQDAGVVEDTQANRQNPQRIIFNPGAGISELDGCSVYADSFWVGTRLSILDDRRPDPIPEYARTHPEVCVRK